MFIIIYIFFLYFIIIIITMMMMMTDEYYNYSTQGLFPVIVCREAVSERGKFGTIPQRLGFDTFLHHRKYTHVT